MRKKQYQRWQVILCVIGFLLIMGVAGKSDQDSRQAHVDETVNVRDAIKFQYAAEENQDQAYYDQKAR